LLSDTVSSSDLLEGQPAHVVLQPQVPFLVRNNAQVGRGSLLLGFTLKLCIGVWRGGVVKRPLSIRPCPGWLVVGAVGVALLEV
jgi:hypothetical protein